MFPTTGEISTYKAATTNDDPYFAGFDTQFFADPELLEPYQLFSQQSCSDPNAIPISQLDTLYGTRSKQFVYRQAVADFSVPAGRINRLKNE